MNKIVPFVITEDIQSITRNSPFVLSGQMAKYVSMSVIEICKEFITPNVLLLGESTMTKWIAKVTPPNAIIQTVAYTDLLNPGHAELHTTRATTWQQPKTAIQVPRYGYPSLETQLQFVDKGEYVLVDDVIFSGMGCKEVILKGRELGRNITKVICCVSVGTGKKQLDDLGVKMESLYHFERVVDEVCLRDFIPGLPFSGRPFVQDPDSFSGKHRFVPYLLPWGNPNQHVSVPVRNKRKFSIACLELAVEFWSKVAPELKLIDAPAPIYDLDVDENILLWRYLHQHKEKLENKG